ncbi:4302_t:CDS:2, partial [Ambispora gerdemannii]
ARHKPLPHYNGRSQYVCQHLTERTLVAKNFYSYFGYIALSEGIEALQKTLEALRDDPKLGGYAKVFLTRNDFFKNNNVELYFMRKERKVKEKISTETTLSMVNKRLDMATEIVHKNVLGHLEKELGKGDHSEENDGQDEATSSTLPAKIENSNNTNTKEYLNELPLHAEYSCMGEDWMMDGIVLSNNLKGTSILGRGHFNFSDTECTSQISDEHWDNVIVPFLTKHKLKNAFYTEGDEKKLVDMFEENKKKLLEQGNLNLIYSLCDTEENTTKILEIVKRIRLVLYLKGFADCRTLTSLERKWPISLPSDILDKRLRGILWAAELIKWVIAQWQDGTFFKEMKEQWVKTQLASRLLVPVSPVKPGEIESNAEKLVANYKKALMSPKIKAKTRVDGLDDDEGFENVWVELKGGFGAQHEAENKNNLEDLDVLLKGFSTMSAMQAPTLPEEAKNKIGELEFFGIRGMGNLFQFWGCFQASRYLMCSYLLGEFCLPSFEGREELLELSYQYLHCLQIRVETSKLKFHQIRALARSKRVFEGDSSPIKAKRVRE